MRRKSERNKATTSAAATTASPEKSPAKKTTTRTRARKSTAPVADTAPEIEPVDEQLAEQHADDESRSTEAATASQSGTDIDERAAQSTATASDSDDEPVMVVEPVVPSTPSRSGRKPRGGRARSSTRVASEEPEDTPSRPSRSRRRTVQPRYAEVAEDDEEEFERQLQHQQKLLLLQQQEEQEQLRQLREEAEQQQAAAGVVVEEESEEVVEEEVVTMADNVDDAVVECVDEDAVAVEVESADTNNEVEEVEASEEQQQPSEVADEHSTNPSAEIETEVADVIAVVVPDVNDDDEVAIVQNERAATPEPVPVEERKTSRRTKSSPTKKKRASRLTPVNDADETMVIGEVAISEVAVDVPVVIATAIERSPTPEVSAATSASPTVDTVVVAVEAIQSIADDSKPSVADEDEAMPTEEATTGEQTDEDQTEITIEASSPGTEQLLEKEAEAAEAVAADPPSTRPHWRRGRTRASSTSSSTSVTVLAVADAAEPADAIAEEPTATAEVIPEETEDETSIADGSEPIDNKTEDDDVNESAAAESNGDAAEFTADVSETTANDVVQTEANVDKTDNVSDQSAPVAVVKPAKPVKRKRKWLTTKSADAAKPPPILVITTESIKELIADGRPVPLVDVKLDSSPEPEDRPTVVNTAPAAAAAIDVESSEVVVDMHRDEEAVTTKVLVMSTEKVDRPSAAGIAVSGGRKVMLINANEAHSNAGAAVAKAAAAVRPPSPAKFGCSHILYITNLVRPFTVQQLKALLARTGKLCENGFWIDKIKSKCYVKYETEDEAVETRHALHGVRWPTANPKCLNVDFGSEATMLKVIETIPSADGVRPMLAGVAGNVREERVAAVGGGGWDRFDADEMRDKPVKRPVREWDLGKREDLLVGGRDDGADEAATHKATAAAGGAADAAHHDERVARGADERGARKRSTERLQQRRTVSKSPARKLNKKENEPPLRLLDDLFRKTKATPCIYWLPLTAEQISVKEEARSVQLAEHRRKVEEAALKEKERQREREKDREQRDRDRDHRDRDRDNSRRNRSADRRDRSKTSKTRTGAAAADGGDRDRDRRRY